MEQDVRFCELDGRRIAYASVGEGPLLLFSGRWVSHLEEEWEDRRARSFYEQLAESHRVVRYDRLGVGLSDRTLPGPPTPAGEALQLEAVLDACGGEPATVFACSCAGLATSRFASESPDRVRKVVFFGGYASRDDIPEATRRSGTPRGSTPACNSRSRWPWPRAWRRTATTAASSPACLCR